MQNTELISEEIVNLLVQASERGTFKTEEVLQLTVELGVNGECESDIRDILRSFCKKQEVDERLGGSRNSSNQAVQILLHALRKTEQNDLVNEICSLTNTDIEPSTSLASNTTSKSPQNNKECTITVEEGDEETKFIPEKDPVPGTTDSQNVLFARLSSFLPSIGNKCLTKASCCWGIVSTAIVIFVILYFVPTQAENALQYDSIDSSIATTVATGYISTTSNTTTTNNTTTTTTTTLKQDQQGAIVIGKAGTVDWINACPTDKYTNILLDLGIKIKYYGFTQVEDEIWLCGGQDEKREQSTTCRVLNLLDGQWRIFEYKMKHSRIKSWMFVEGSRVIVMGGTTSDINSNTGCRAFDRNNPTEGWTIEDIKEIKEVCDGSSKILKVNCH